MSEKTAIKLLQKALLMDASAVRENIKEAIILLGGSIIPERKVRLQVTEEKNESGWQGPDKIIQMVIETSEGVEELIFKLYDGEVYLERDTLKEGLLYLAGKL